MTANSERRRLSRSLAGSGVAVFACALAASAQAREVILAMDVEIDQVAPEDAQMYRVGGHDRDRIGYDDTQVDPKTRRVRVNYLAHYIAGKFVETAPTDASSLDMSTLPYKLQFSASVTHGRPIVALFESETQRMAMLARPDFHMLIAGKYTIDPKALTPAEIASPPRNANSPDTMPMMRSQNRAEAAGGAMTVPGKSARPPPPPSPR